MKTNKHLKYVFLVLILFLAAGQVEAEVSYSSLKGFFEATYDQDKDGQASLDDFIEYFRFIEPEHDVEK